MTFPIVLLIIKTMLQQYIHRSVFSKFYLETRASLQLVYHVNSSYTVLNPVHLSSLFSCIETPLKLSTFYTSPYFKSGNNGHYIYERVYSSSSLLHYLLNTGCTCYY